MWKWNDDKVTVKEWENRCRWLLEGSVGQTNFIEDDNDKVKGYKDNKCGNKRMFS